jgi:signal transduction histidine kinase
VPTPLRRHGVRRHGARWQSVRWRSTIVTVSVTGLALAAGALALLFFLRQHALGAAAQSAQQGADQIASQMAHQGIQQGEPFPYVVPGDGTAQIVDGNGQVVAASAGSPSAPVARLRLPPGQRVGTRITSGTSNGPRLLAAVGVRSSDGPDYTVLVTVPIGQSEDTLNQAAVLLAGGLPVLLLVVVALTYWLTGRSLAPVEAIRAEVAEISQADLVRRIPVPGTRDEIARLAETMNAMLARLGAAQLTQRRFVADASHELRSPLATLASSLELAEQDGWRISPEQLAGMREEVHRLAGMVDGLLLLARADERGLRPGRADVDLDDLVDAERTRLRRTTHLTVHADLQPVKIYGDRATLAQVVRNLTDNAARYARSTVRLTVATRDGQAVLEVADDGPGIPAADRDRVFDRFVRLDTARQRSRGGAGLGLAIVREIVSAHGGRIEVVDAPEGGSGFHIVFPSLIPDGDEPADQPRGSRCRGDGACRRGG